MRASARATSPAQGGAQDTLAVVLIVQAWRWTVGA